jgi:hypothetical protein
MDRRERKKMHGRNLPGGDKRAFVLDHVTFGERPLAGFDSSA